MIITLGMYSPVAAEETKIDTRAETKTKIDARATVKAELDSRIKMLEEQARETKDLMKKNPEKVEDRVKEMKKTVDDLKSKSVLITPESGDDQVSGQDEKTPMTAKEQLMKHGQTLLERLVAAVDRQTTLANRLASRLEIMANAGIKVEEANTKLAEAQKSIEAAKTSVLGLGDKLGELLGTIDTSKKEVLVTLRETAQSTIKLIQDAHKKLLDAINVVKKANVEVKAKAETSN